MAGFEREGYPFMMRPKSKNPDMPPRLQPVTRTLRSGKVWTSYYYNGRGPDGKRRMIPLGKDLDAAKRKWAELECKPVATRYADRAPDDFWNAAAAACGGKGHGSGAGGAARRHGIGRKDSALPVS